MESWRLLDLEYSDPYLNMAVEEAILLAVDRGLASNTIRFWRNAKSVVVGCFQDVSREVDLKACAKHGVTVVRRFTGGGTVYHDHGNLNWTMVIKKEHPFAPKMPTEIFKVASSAVIEGISSLEANAQFKLPNVIQIGGRKISGLAAYVKKNAILCHGTLLINTDLNVLSEVLNIDHDFNGLSHLRSTHAEVTTLQRVLNKYIPMPDAKESILLGFEKLYNIIVIPGRLNDYEKEMAKTLYYNKYVKKEWNLQAKLVYVLNMKPPSKPGAPWPVKE